MHLFYIYSISKKDHPDLTTRYFSFKYTIGDSDFIQILVFAFLQPFTSSKFKQYGHGLSALTIVQNEYQSGPERQCRSEVAYAPPNLSLNPSTTQHSEPRRHSPGDPQASLDVALVISMAQSALHSWVLTLNQQPS